MFLNAFWFYVVRGNCMVVRVSRHALAFCTPAAPRLRLGTLRPVPDCTAHTDERTAFGCTIVAVATDGARPS